MLALFILSIRTAPDASSQNSALRATPFLSDGTVQILSINSAPARMPSKHVPGTHRVEVCASVPILPLAITTFCFEHNEAAALASKKCAARRSPSLSSGHSTII